ncbi:MAG: ATP-binding cassette domain-containing protein [Candidatus Omnitrophica bacterium]|nr:ATP-binding cassette domain-containing protein [Candidatus Omnitrophota bacterium]
MKNVYKLFTGALRKLRYIGRLVVTTPRWGLIIFLQILSGLLSFAGLPMLVPVLNILKDGSISAGNEKYLLFMGKGLELLGIEPGFFSILTIAALFIFSGQLLVFLSSLIAANAQAELSEKYRKDLFNAYGSAKWLWLLDSRSGEMNFSVIREADIASVAHLNAQRIVIYFVQVSVLIFVVIRLSPVITLFSMTVYGLLLLLSVLISNQVYKLADLYNRKFRKLSNDLNGLQQNKKFFKASMLNKRLIDGIFTHVHEIANTTKKQNFFIETQRALSLMLTFIFMISLMFFHRQLSLDYSVLMLVLLIFIRISPQFAALSTAYATLDSNIPMHRSLCGRLRDLENNTEENGTQQYAPDREVRFENVSFIYPNGNRVFEGLDITIEPGKTTSFIGGSGVGKSTLLDLVLGLLKPSSGAIYYGNIRHDTLDKVSLRSRVAYVSQNTTLVDGTMKENLTIGLVDCDEDRIREITRKVALEEVIDQMAEGLDTHVGENGIKLSGGQRQRVALARALFREPDILILDEATSSLDAESENMIQETIKSLQKDFTIIVVTHKLNAVRFSDIIYVLEDGKVCEAGSYTELLARKGRLYELDSLQA